MQDLNASEKLRARCDIILWWNTVSKLWNEQQPLVLQPFVKIYGLIRLSHEIERLRSCDPFAVGEMMEWRL